MNIVRTIRIGDPPRAAPRQPLHCLLLIGVVGLVPAAHAVPAVHAAQPATTPPPLQIDLDAFEARKKTVALPNGEVLAYIDMGMAAGPAVVLIHGYTDNARDWVPLLPYLS